MADPITEARIRARRYWYRDGLTEIPLGIVQLLLGGSDLILALANRTSSWFVPVNLLYTVSMIVLAVFASRIMAALRERLTYPRSGYVDYGESVRKLRIGVGMVLVTLVAAAVVLASRYAGRVGLDPSRLTQWAPAVCGLTTGAVGVYVTVRYGLPRFLVVGVLATILGVVVCVEYPPMLATAIWLSAVGCAWLCSGGVALWNYLRTTAPAADAT
jgi:hypothetical protein